MESLSAYQSTFKPECILTGKKTNSARAKDCSCAEGVPKRSVGMKRKRNGGKPVFCFSKNAPTKHKTTELDTELNYNSRTSVRMYNNEAQPAVPPLTLAIYHADNWSDFRFLSLIKNSGIDF